MRLCNIAVRSPDYAPFLKTHGNSVRFDRSALPSVMSFFTQNTARHDHNTRQRHQHEILFSHTSRARKFIQFHIPLLLRSMPTCIIDKIYTHSLNGFSNYTKQYMLASYENSCQTRNCYVCAHAYAGMSVFITIIHILYIFISCIVYRLFCFTSSNCICS